MLDLEPIKARLEKMEAGTWVYRAASDLVDEVQRLRDRDDHAKRLAEDSMRLVCELDYLWRQNRVARTQEALPGKPIDWNAMRKEMRDDA
jgi:hypothetical protein